MSDNEYTPTTDDIVGPIQWEHSHHFCNCSEDAPGNDEYMSGECARSYNAGHAARKKRLLALAAHDRQVAAKALTDAAMEIPHSSTITVPARNAAGWETVHADEWLNARAAALMSSTPGNGYVSNSTPWWAESSTPEQEEER